MGPTMKDLGIDQLRPEQQIALALEIWESLEVARPGVPLSAARKAELERRDAEMDANPGLEMTWEQMRAQLGWR